MSRLSVNINKIATLRNARGGNVPDLLKVALDCEKYGAEGITVHPRPDERHIRYQDVRDLKKILNTEFNIEGYPSESFIDLVLDVKPAQVTLVPDPPNVLTSNAGWDVKKESEKLIPILETLRNRRIRTSIFMGTDIRQIVAASEIGVDRIELYTGPYAEEYKNGPDLAIEDYISASLEAEKLGLGLNAGHDLNLENLRFFKTKIPSLLEVSIGHALIADSLYYGLENTIQLYKRCLI